MARDFETGLPGWENRVAAVGWGNVVIAHVGSEKNRQLKGLTVEEAAARIGKPALDFVCDLLVEESLDVGDLTVNSCEDDLRAVLTHPWTVVGSDGLDVGDTPHPRQYGTFPRILARYVREEPVLTLESAVHKMTGRTAALFGLAGLGHLRPGYQADVVVFDPATVSDIATYDDPRRFPVGIEQVMVGGVLSVADGRLTGDFGGRVKRRGTE
jgi:dihydroorotase/N-acyl-D-amino-acid deacylase